MVGRYDLRLYGISVKNNVVGNAKDTCDDTAGAHPHPRRWNDHGQIISKSVSEYVRRYIRK